MAISLQRLSCEVFIRCSFCVDDITMACLCGNRANKSCKPSISFDASKVPTLAAVSRSVLPRAFAVLPNWIKSSSKSVSFYKCADKLFCGP